MKYRSRRRPRWQRLGRKPRWVRKREEMNRRQATRSSQSVDPGGHLFYYVVKSGGGEFWYGGPKLAFEHSYPEKEQAASEERSDQWSVTFTQSISEEEARRLEELFELPVFVGECSICRMVRPCQMHLLRKVVERKNGTSAYHDLNLTLCVRCLPIIKALTDAHNGRLMN